jgi:hypothetical protein
MHWALCVMLWALYVMLWAHYSVPHDKTVFLATESDLKTGAFSLTGTEAPFLLHFFTLKLAKKG